MVQEEMSFKEKLYGHTPDARQWPVTIAHIEPSAQVSLKKIYFLVIFRFVYTILTNFSSCLVIWWPLNRPLLIKNQVLALKKIVYTRNLEILDLAWITNIFRENEWDSSLEHPKHISKPMCKKVIVIRNFPIFLARRWGMDCSFSPGNVR